MTTTYGQYDWVFDEVQFGIDVREARRELGTTQKELAAVLGYSSAGVLNVIERGRDKGQLKIADFLKLCNFLELKPEKYFTVERGAGADISAGWEV